MRKLENIKINKSVFFALFVAIITITLCSRSSFLVPYNNWDDANSYFSMGKGLFNGKIIYRDIFDQKGPYLYLFYGIGYLLSNQTFFGVYLVEIVAAAFFFYGAYKILRRYADEAIAFSLLPVLGAVVYSSVSFWWGGSAEEFCLPFLVWPFYYFLFLIEKEEFEKKDDKKVLLTGICAGIVALIKFNILGFFAPWGIFLFLKLLLKKEYKGLLALCGWFFLGFLLPFLPWFIYFGLNNGLKDWYKAYIYYNVFVYADFSREEYTLYDKIYQLAKILYWLILEHIRYFAFIILGVICYLADRNTKLLDKAGIVFLCSFTFLGIYIGGVELKYYSFPLTVFAVLGFCYLGKGIQKLLNKGPKRLLGKWQSAGILLTLLLSVGIMYFGSINTEAQTVKKEEHYLYRLQQLMEITEDTTLLNISSFDIGLYTVTGIVPNCYWFQTQTLPIEDVLVEQAEYMKQGKTDYVVARDYYPEVIREQYELIGEETDPLRDCKFYLFEKKEK